jgi:type VI protein secretion system component VasK
MNESPMKAWLHMFKPLAWGFVIGAVVTMVVGFSWGGWTTSSTADRLAMERATTAVTAALVPVCVEKSKADPAQAKKLVALKALSSSYAQRDAVAEGGWATFAGGEANSNVADLCAVELLKVAVQ